jgi:hypothetical protein
MNNTQDGVIKALETLVLHSIALKEHKRNETMIEKTLEVHEHKLDLLCQSITTLSYELLKLKGTNAITFGVN